MKILLSGFRLLQVMSINEPRTIMKSNAFHLNEGIFENFDFFFKFVLPVSKIVLRIQRNYFKEGFKSENRRETEIQFIQNVVEGST